MELKCQKCGKKLKEVVEEGTRKIVGGVVRMGRLSEKGSVRVKKEVLCWNCYEKAFEEERKCPFCGRGHYEVTFTTCYSCKRRVCLSCASYAPIRKVCVKCGRVFEPEEEDIDRRFRILCPKCRPAKFVCPECIKKYSEVTIRKVRKEHGLPQKKTGPKVARS